MSSEEEVAELWRHFYRLKARVDADGAHETGPAGVARLTGAALEWEKVAKQLARLLPAEEAPPTSLLELVVGP